MAHKLGISSMSLGRAWNHALVPKLDAAVRHGYQGLEIFYEDLQYHSKTFPGATTQARELAAAHSIRTLCAARNLHIINLQPFSQYDGLRDRSAHSERIAEATHWFALCAALGTNLIQVPASFLPAAECSGSRDLIIADLRELSDLGAAYDPPLRFVYEALAWSTHVDTWEESYAVVQAVDRPNFGLCLDTYNILGRIYADPTSETGVTPDADEVVAQSIERLVKIDLAKVFFIQVVTAERLAEPLTPQHPFHVEGQPPRMSWSRNCRLFYGESDYLPVREFTDAIVNRLGYKGWISFELFNRSMNEEGVLVPEEHARRGAAAWETMIEELGLDVEQRQVPQVDKVEVKVDSPQMMSLL